jgi:hypothetical protein
MLCWSDAQSPGRIKYSWLKSWEIIERALFPALIFLVPGGFRNLFVIAGAEGPLAAFCAPSIVACSLSLALNCGFVLEWRRQDKLCRTRSLPPVE